MGLINEKDANYLRGLFAKELKSPVKFVLFVSEHDCQYCGELKEILSELCELSDKLSLEVFDAEKDKEMLSRYKIELVPGLAVMRMNGEPIDYGVRFYGIPAGYEFTALIESIYRVSTGESGLSDAAKQRISELKSPLHIKIFVTPTCPHCPHAVALAHRLAVESQLVHSDMIEAVEFPELADKYSVYAVPKIIVNDTYSFEGALPEMAFIEEILKGIE